MSAFHMSIVSSMYFASIFEVVISTAIFWPFSGSMSSS